MEERNHRSNEDTQATFYARNYSNTALLNLLEKLHVIDFTEFMKSRKNLFDPLPDDESVRTEEYSESEHTLQVTSDLVHNNAVQSFNRTEYRIISIDALLHIASNNGYPIADYTDEVRIYNGTHWEIISKPELSNFLLEAIEKLGVPRMICRDADFIKKCTLQLQLLSYVEPSTDSSVAKLNFQNGTVEFSDDGYEFKSHDPFDYINYVLPYEYDSNAGAPLFHAFLERVLPQEDKRLVIAEFFASCFYQIKHEKVLISFGSGSNGKSVLYDIVSAVLGAENVSSYTLESLTDSSGYYRGKLAEFLLNYSGEISTKVNSDWFKKLASGEKISARYPYGRPFEITNYARLAFNSNELPASEDTSEGFYRRFLIISFEEYIPEDERDLHLAEKIIASELPGIINWILDGLSRLQENDGFSKCESADEALHWYKRNTNSVISFIESEDFNQLTFPIKSSLLYSTYQEYCASMGMQRIGSKTFSIQFERSGFDKRRRSDGSYFFKRATLNVA